MTSSIQLGYPEVPRSITNPSVKDINALDVNNPLSFLEFIKNISVSYDPDSLQSYYNTYLQRWNSKSVNKYSTNDQLIVENYRTFIKDISIRYTTAEERKFLSKLDFTDPLDLEVAIPFYSRKLKEIAQYYNKKREDLKFEITRKKLLGTNFGAAKTISELCFNYLDNLEDGKLLFNIDTLKQKLEIEIEELYDVYPTYFNQIPDPHVFDKKDLDYGQDIFLRSNEDLISDIFAGVSEALLEIKEVDQLFDNKRLLSERSVSTDFYYLSTGETVTNFLSGKLFDAVSPQRNILNRDYPTTASTPRPILQNTQDVGFFTPIKSGLIFVDGKNESYQINFDNLEPNTIYYFPDPNIIGSDQDVISFKIDDSYLKRNFSSGNAVNQPTQDGEGGTYYGYVSKPDSPEQKYLNSIFDNGYVYDSKWDVYGNLYGLFKYDTTFNSGIINVETNTIKNLLLNGHTFFDDLYGEGYDFNYLTYDDTKYLETLRSGLSSYTNGFSALSSPYTLFLRYFDPYQELIGPTEESLVIEYAVYDGGFFKKDNGSDYDDPISSDLDAFEGSASTFYFTELLESGLYSSTPIDRALLDPAFPTLTANFTQTARTSGSNGVETLDGGEFTAEYDFSFEFSDPTYDFISDVYETTEYTLSTYDASYFNDRHDLNGKMFIKNTYTNQVLPLEQTLTYLYTKYSTSIYNQLTGQISRFEVAYDTVFIETPEYLVVEKIEFDGKAYTNPKTPTYTLAHNLSSFDRLSNRFKVDSFVYYAKLKTVDTIITSNNFLLYPEIYRFNLLNFENDLIFPINDSQITSQFSVSGGSIRYVKSESPVLTFNSKNNLFNISFLLKDQNNLIAIHEYDFDYSSDVNFIAHNIKYPTADQGSNIFNSDYADTLSVYLSSISPSTLEEEITI